MPISVQCFTCRHYWGINHCDAYPEEFIPEVILIGDHDHTKPYKGDHGVRWEALPPRTNPVAKGGPGSGNFGHAGTGAPDGSVSQY